MPDRREQLRARLMATFKVEAEEHLQMLNANLEALESHPAPAEQQELVEVTFREMHTLKGAARSVGIKHVESLCQACESLLSRLHRDRVPVTPSIRQVLQEALDALDHLLSPEGDAHIRTDDLVGRLEQALGTVGAGTQVSAPPAPTFAPPVPEPSSGETSQEGPGGAGPRASIGPARASLDSIRIPTGKLDRLLVEAESLLMPKLAVGERAQEARSLAESVTKCRQMLGSRLAARAGNGSAPARLHDLEALLHDAESRTRQLIDHLTIDHRSMGSAVDAVLVDMRGLRMMPAAAILEAFPRMVRDLALKDGKEVTWTVTGGDLEIDRKVLETIKDPLIHLVRNAVDHGIEPPQVRLRSGKTAGGRVSLAIAALERGWVEISLEDDGQGIDLEGVREAAVRVRLVTAEAARTLTDDQVLELIYRSGLSTSPIITEVSGHGLGLAIVRERVERLDGRITVESRPGAGTKITMVIPATIATFRGLLVRVGEHPFLVPLEAVERVIRVTTDHVHQVEGREAIHWASHTVPFGSLDRVLGLSSIREDRNDGCPRPCVILASGPHRCALAVDEVQGDREGLLKDLQPPLVRVRNVSSAALLGTGEVVLVLHPVDLLKSVRLASTTRPAATLRPERTRQKIILVVDDSITTRTMEKNLLEAAGFHVKVAVDGLDALTVLRSEPVDVVLSDVDMPRMNGFELTSRIRGDRKLADLPVILVTALESREDKERGIEVGANAYMVKSSFDQTRLLEILRPLL
ncbi:MAG: hybrid sensor histidine kinase/response regulator [Nitrospirales bacterium]